MISGIDIRFSPPGVNRKNAFAIAGVQPIGYGLPPSSIGYAHRHAEDADDVCPIDEIQCGLFYEIPSVDIKLWFDNAAINRRNIPELWHFDLGGIIHPGNNPMSISDVAMDVKYVGIELACVGIVAVLYRAADAPGWRPPR